ncbi:MAG TPA: carboxypeptidase-like regulatory domain-containing protein [Pyrinomonadaceae bacterium]|nr:carboxypeptidase-like regulatory domain-containing protein [Pyrinomonadaceae bacterium]
MRDINTFNFKLRSLATAILLSFAMALFGGAAQVLAHGGEDHGEAKPATATTTAGTVTRSVQLGDFEIMLKHSPLEPDAAATGRFFVTKFATNEPVGDANPALEIESATGAVTEIPIEKTDATGSYTVKIPALPEGAYTIRTRAMATGGKTDTATFSGVEIAQQESAAVDAGSSSWRQTALMAMLFLVALALFGGLAYFAVRVFKNKPLGEETVSA